jgi:hypothetical protein
VAVENVYEETFEGDVGVGGTIHIWWRDRPEVEATLSLDRQAHLLLDPGERYYIEANWYLTADDGRYVLSLLDFSGMDIRYGVHYARPEVFVLEVKVTLFEETGLLTSGPHEFLLEGWKLAPLEPEQPTSRPGAAASPDSTVSAGGG